MKTKLALTAKSVGSTITNANAVSKFQFWRTTKMFKKFLDAFKYRKRIIALRVEVDNLHHELRYTKEQRRDDLREIIGLKRYISDLTGEDYE